LNAPDSGLASHDVHMRRLIQAALPHAPGARLSPMGNGETEDSIHKPLKKQGIPASDTEKAKKNPSREAWV
jgi:hypothetical protein